MNPLTARKIIPLRELPDTPRCKACQAPIVETMKTRPIDVLTDMPNVYSLDKGTIRQIKPGESLCGKILLAKTGGLSEDQRKNLKEQNVEIHDVKGMTYLKISELAANWILADHVHPDSASCG